MVPVDVKMAWRNIWRNPRRTLLTIAAIAFACVLLVFMLSFQFGSYDTMINASVRIHTGHLQVQARGYQADQKIRQVIADPRPVQQALDAMPEVLAHAPRARAFALVSSADRAYGVMVEGIVPEAEAQVSTLPKIIRQGEYLSDDPVEEGLPDALIGNLLARNLKVAVGDELTVLGQGRDGSIAATVVRVRGIYSSGMDDFDRSAIQIPLADFQAIFTMDMAVHEIVVVGRRLSGAPVIKAALQDKLAGLAAKADLVVLDWEDLMPGLRQAINMDLVSGSIFYLILIMVVAFSILNTFLMAIFERTYEFGVMMAMGTKPQRLTRLVLAESTGMTLVGVAAGMVLGCLVTFYFMHHGINLGANEISRQFGIPDTLYPRLTAISITAGPLAVLLITLLAALYPALKIRKLKPVEAMRQR
ncbi:ABC transporter permease [Desulfosarcina widdelii]|uniref:ABC transporter permease n=1 Tax=Desulfosarcina widdelii TaxID=947919 RepID=A0A5K7ZF91_9BACT|nr:FtsX-like permease family protein [Desulfosarcina widdelii]BBO77074.1 ABC transporter permease [Desulfosarcina widdelii]